MKLAIASFSPRGRALGEELAALLCDLGHEAAHQSLQGDDTPTLGEWVGEHFDAHDGLIFIGAAGIAVRGIAPFLVSKTSDPAVVALDEAGRHVIPLASGHIGGAGALAGQIAALTGGEAVLTAATDTGGVFAVDIWAVSQGLLICTPFAIKDVSARLLAGKTVRLYSELPVDGEPPLGVELVDTPEDCHVAITRRFIPGPRLVLVPQDAVLGVGCRKGISAGDLSAATERLLGDFNKNAIGRVCSIDLKAQEPGLLEFCRGRRWPLETFSATELAAVPGDFSASPFVEEVTGVDNVCERAAVRGSGGRLLLEKQTLEGVTMALAVPATRLAFPQKPRRLYVVGLGPGEHSRMTVQARDALEDAGVICGYTGYIDLIRHRYPHKELLSTPMKGEIARCRLALERAAAGDTVAMVCSGDAGIYGMAGPVLELAPEYPGVEIRIVPGVTAASSGGAVLGAPLGHDFAVISLSDLLTPWSRIINRLSAAAEADLAICLYNPSSKKRGDYLQKACDILLELLPDDRVCGLVRQIGRQGEEGRLLTLRQLRNTPVDMFTTVFVGNSQTRIVAGRMVTPRGYREV